MNGKIVFFFISVLFFVACGNPPAPQAVVYVYAGYQDLGYEQAYKEFEKETGIKVILKQEPVEDLLKKLEEKNESDSADVLILNDLGLMLKAEKLGLLKPIKREEINEHVPLKYRSPDRLWFGLGKFAKVLVYNKEKVKPEELSSYQDLASPKWSKKLLLSPSYLPTYRSFLASMLAHEGVEKSSEWLEATSKNLASSAQEEEINQVHAIAQGIANLSIVSTDVIGKYFKLKPAAQSKIGVFFPNQSSYGTHINLHTAAVVENAPNLTNAGKLIGFLTSEKGQEILTNQSFVYPIYVAVQANEVLQSWGDFKEDVLDFNFLIQASPLKE